MLEIRNLVVKIADVISSHDALEDAEKAVAGMEIVKSLLQGGKSVVDTINAFMRHLGTVSTGLVQAAPGIGIAINACDMIVNGINIANSYISMVEMRDDKRGTKEKVLGRKANKSSGIRGFFGGHESAKDAARTTITRLGGKSALTDDETTELRTSEDYILSKNLQRIAQKRINRGALNITSNAVNIAGDIAILSAAASATNQNSWIKYMKEELKNYPKLKLVTTVYGNDDPATSLTVLQGLISAYPNLKGIISPTTVGISTAAQYLSTHKDLAKKITLTGLGLPSQMKQYIHDGTVKAFELWNPNDLGYLAGYAAAGLASGTFTLDTGSTFHAGRLGDYKVLAPAAGTGPSVVLGPPTVFDSSNVDKFNF